MLNLAWIVNISGVKLKIFDFWLRPIIAVGAMGVGVLFVYTQLVNFGLGAKLSCMVGACAGVAIYGIMIFAVKAIRRDELMMLPKGEKLVSICEKVHLLR